MIYYAAQFEETFEEVKHSYFISTGFVVLFRDVPEAITQGSSFEEAVEMAEDALRTAMEFYEEDGKEYPTPTPYKQGDVMIPFNKEPL